MAKKHLVFAGMRRSGSDPVPVGSAREEACAVINAKQLKALEERGLTVVWREDLEELGELLKDQRLILDNLTGNTPRDPEEGGGL